MNLEKCELCKVVETRSSNKLITACDCYKKSEDYGRMHRKCLQEFIAEENLMHHRIPTCPRCKCKYKLRFQYSTKLDIAHLCTCKSMWRAIELCMIISQMILFVFSMHMFSTGVHLKKKKNRTEVTKTDNYILFFLTCIIVVSSISVIRIMWKRWKKSVSDVTVIDGDHEVDEFVL